MKEIFENIISARVRALILVIAVSVSCNTTNAQIPTFNEMFKQKKTQKKYLVKQIVLLKTYLGYLKKGYEIADKGLTTIHNIKNGDFNLHRDFFGSLKKVNKHISNSAKVADITAFQIYIVKELKRVRDYVKKNKNFSAEEARYVAAVYSNMLVLSDANISELLTVIRPDKTQMTDDERLSRIDRLHDDMMDKRAFVRSFEDDIQMIARQRAKEKNSNPAFQKLHTQI